MQAYYFTIIQTKNVHKYLIFSILIHKDMTITESKASIKGGEFLIKDIEASQIFIPEEFTEEQQMIAQTCLDFLRT